jgi:hypothetical protein
MLPGQERLLSYPWSSFGAYMAAPEHRPSWVRVDRLLGEHGIQADTPTSRAQFEQWMERRRLEETDPEALKVLRRGWCLGSQSFRREMLLRMEGKLGDHHSGELHRASAEAKAERIIAQELQRQGWQEADLLVRPKNDTVKLEIATRLRRETTLSTKAIAARVHLGSSKAANRSLHRYMRGGEKGFVRLSCFQPVCLLAQKNVSTWRVFTIGTFSGARSCLFSNVRHRKRFGPAGRGQRDRLGP